MRSDSKLHADISLTLALISLRPAIQTEEMGSLLRPLGPLHRQREVSHRGWELRNLHERIQSTRTVKTQRLTLE